MSLGAVSWSISATVFVSLVLDAPPSREQLDSSRRIFPALRDVPPVILRDNLVPPRCVVGRLHEETAKEVQIQAKHAGLRVELLDPSDYDPAFVREAMGVSSPFRELSAEAAIEATILPSLQPELVLRAFASAKGWLIQLFSHQASIRLARFSVPGWITGRPTAEDRVSRHEHRWVDEADLGDADRSALQAAAASLGAPPPGPLPARSFDEVLVELRTLNAGEVVEHRLLAPTAESCPEAFRLLAALYQAAYRTMPAATSRERLEALARTLRLALPVEVIDSGIRRFRFFGALSAADVADLRALLGDQDPRSTLVMDFTEVGFLAGAVLPVLRDFDDRRGLTVWISGTRLARELVRGGISSGRVAPKIFVVDDAFESAEVGAAARGSPIPTDAVFRKGDRVEVWRTDGSAVTVDIQGIGKPSGDLFLPKGVRVSPGDLLLFRDGTTP